MYSILTSFIDKIWCYNLRQFIQIVIRQSQIQIDIFYKLASHIQLKMLSDSLYDPQSLSLLMESQLKFKPELHIDKTLILKERDVIVQIMYMVSGLQTLLFRKKANDYAFQVDLSSLQIEESYRFQLRKDIKVNFTHLSFQTIRQCSKAPLQIANSILYLQSNSQLMYKKTQNIILKSFCQGIMNFLSKFQKQNTQILTKIQMENGKVMWNKNQDIRMVQEKQQQNVNNCPQSYLSLIKISKHFAQKKDFLKRIVSVLGKLLPYMSPSPKINAQESKNHAYMATEILFNEFALLINESFLSSEDFGQILMIFSQSLKLYIGMIRDWLQMNPYQLQVKKQSGFFIKTENINYSLSKSISYQSISLLKSRNRNNFLLKENIHLSEDFVDRFFNFQSLLVNQYMPKIFQTKAKSILELGKIIQFIYLYYNPQQRPHLIQYFAIKQQFKPIFDFILDYCQNQSTHDQTNKFEQENKIGMFPLKKFKCSTIGQKLMKTKKKMMRFIQVKQDNPYSMFPSTRGVFVQQQNMSQKINVPKRHFATSTERSQLKDSKQQSSQQNKQNFIYFFDKLLGETIEIVYKKVIYFFARNCKENVNYMRNTQSLIEINSVVFYNFNNIAVSNPSRILDSINTTLIGIKKFMLYEQGDFILQFVASVHNLFQNSFSKISKSLVHSMIDQAIKSSSAKELPQQMKDNVTFMYIKKSNDLQIKHLKGWTVFSLLYKPPFPTNCIFTDKIMSEFAQVFNFILNIKKCQFYLKGIWDDFKQDGKIQTAYSLYKLRRHPFQSKILAIRNNIHHFVNSVFGYVMIQIQYYWDEYMNQLNFSFQSSVNGPQQNPSIVTEQPLNSQKKALNPIDIIDLTKKMLQNLKLQTVKNLTLSNTMLLILELLDRFMKLQRIKLQSKQYNEILFRQQLQRVDHQFLGIMDIAKTIQGIGETIEFNHQFF